MSREDAGSPHEDRAPGTGAWFTTTRWSVVLAAGAGKSAESREAWNELCRAYWYPIYAYARRCGQTPQDAEDSVQAFFATIFSGGVVEVADPARGRFRSFLLIAFKRHAGHEREKARAQKRSPAAALVSLDALSAEERYAFEPVDRLSADRLFDRRWALTLLDRVVDRLRTEQEELGRENSFELLKETLTDGGRGTPYADLAARLGMNEGAVKVAVHRLRKRYRELLEDEIAQTVTSPADLEDERRHLLDALRE